MSSVARKPGGRCASTYLALFFLTVAAAPHHHLNDLEDLLLDQRSDSGIVLQAVGSAGVSDALAVRQIRIASDVPCLACFTRDFVSVPTTSIHFVAGPGRLPLLPSPPGVATPALVVADAASRAPPRRT